MDSNDFGIEEIVETDRTYRGSRYAEVREAIFANPYQPVWGAQGAPLFPDYQTTLGSLLRGLFSFGRYRFGQAVVRSVDSHADLRWGPDRKGFRRLIHPNGICLTGIWEISEETGYSGYFARGGKALVIARYSSRLPRRGQKTRSLALVGKLYPTQDPDHAEPLRTAGFITQEDLGGDYSEYINDAELRNAPDVSPWRQGIGLPILMVNGVVLTLVDKKAKQRQLYQIAELGKSPSEATRSPSFMRLLVAPEQPRIPGEGLDFRDEIMAQIFDKDHPTPKRKLKFLIELTDDGSRREFLGVTRWRFENWRRVGTLTFDNAVASYNGDFVIHFNHPGWREDKNDPSTAHRAPLARA
jgi:hypothetical protein